MVDRALMLGNAAIARGLLEAGCEVITAYPGTPSTELLEEVFAQKEELGLDVYAEWSVNEKIAFDVALAAAICGKRAATAMKQVGLNVASDSLLSAAYTGVEGGFVVVPCDDPGPYSSQTEQDSRLFALFAKVPVLDPSSPREARDMARTAVELSERHKLPVILRPTTRVCHARQAIGLEPVAPSSRPATFKKDPARWAATPRHRRVLHGLVNEKLEAIRREFEDSPLNYEEKGNEPLGIIASGMAWAIVRDFLREEGRDVSSLKIGTPFPLPVQRVMRFVERHEQVLVLEEPDFAIEIQLPDRAKVRGRLSGHVPRQGELTPDVVARILGSSEELAAPPPGPPPRLCPGCGHRAAFYAIRKAFPKGIFTGDIGCYTLGLNQRALDTCLDMGASITLATGFTQAFRRDGRDVPIVAELGDSTFFHSGLPALLNAVVTNARFIVVVLDNGTVAMTGHQPTPADSGADIEAIARGAGARFVETIDPYEVDELVALLKRARAFTLAEAGGLAVVVARRPCALITRPEKKVHVEILAEACDGCKLCLTFGECPALVFNRESKIVELNRSLCVDCGMCLAMCPQQAIVRRGEV